MSFPPVRFISGTEWWRLIWFQFRFFLILIAGWFGSGWPGLSLGRSRLDSTSYPMKELHETNLSFFSMLKISWSGINPNHTRPPYTHYNILRKQAVEEAPTNSQQQEPQHVDSSTDWESPSAKGKAGSRGSTQAADGKGTAQETVGEEEAKRWSQTGRGAMEDCRGRTT